MVQKFSKFLLNWVMWYKLNFKIQDICSNLFGREKMIKPSLTGLAKEASDIGRAIFDTTKIEFITDLGPMPLNCLIFQDKADL